MSTQCYSFLIIYDITDNKNRKELSTLLEGYGDHVQKSAYEINVPSKRWPSLLQSIKACPRDQDDSIRIYSIDTNSLVFSTESKVTPITIF